MAPKTELQKFLDAPKQGKLIGPLERHMMQRPQGDRRTDVLHPSEIIKKDWCYRYQTYLLLGGEKTKKNPNLKLQSIFDEGHFIHAKWQKWFQEMGVLYGRWDDADGKNLGWHRANVLPDTSQYREVPLKLDKYRIAGHSDGWIKGIGDDCLIEIKSIGSGTLRFEAPDILAKNDGDLMKSWSDIRRPFRSHILQGQLYLWLCEQLFGEDAPKEIVFIYELKADQSYKEFVVKYNPEILEKVMYGIEYVNDYADMGRLPKCNISTDGCALCSSIEETE
jgi:hypothetical protein